MSRIEPWGRIDRLVFPRWALLLERIPDNSLSRQSANKNPFLYVGGFALAVAIVHDPGPPFALILPKTKVAPFEKPMSRTTTIL